MRSYEKQKSNEHNQQPGRIKRIIAALGLAALAVAIPSSESQQLTREDITRAFLQSDAPVSSEYVIPTINPKKQGINPDNPRLDKTISIDKPVISVTHPGFIINGIRVGKEGINDGSADLTDDFYEVYAGIIKDPNFWQYWNNSQELVSSLDASSHTCIFNIEDSDTESYDNWNGPQGVISYVQPPKKCFVMTTEQSSVTVPI